MIYISANLPRLIHLSLKNLSTQNKSQHLLAYTIACCSIVWFVSSCCRHLGRIASGMSCKNLQLWANESDVSELLRFITELPGGLRPALVRICETSCSPNPAIHIHWHLQFFQLLFQDKVYCAAKANSD